MEVVEPTRRQVLEFCADDPVERVFLEDAARRGFGRFAGVAGLLEKPVSLRALLSTVQRYCKAHAPEPT